jgi:hypothetical protein
MLCTNAKLAPLRDRVAATNTEVSKTTRIIKASTLRQIIAGEWRSLSRNLVLCQIRT